VFEGGVDPRTVNPKAGNLGQVTPGDLSDIMTTTTVGGVTSFTATITKIPKELGPKNLSIGVTIDSTEVEEEINASYTAVTPYDEEFFTEDLAPSSVFELATAELDETNPVKILFNGNFGGVVKGNLYNSDLVTTSIDMIGVYSYKEDDLVSVFADLGGLSAGVISANGFLEISEIILINEEGQFVIYIEELKLGDSYAFSVFYTVSWTNEDGTHTSLTEVSLDIPDPANAYVAAA
jgi:hypothetical protein